MTPDMNWSNIEIDHVKSNSLLNVFKDDEINEAFNWNITRPISTEVHLSKGTKFDFLAY